MDPNIEDVGEACIIDDPDVHGACTAGEYECRQNGEEWGLHCKQLISPGDRLEVCDGLDNSCSGSVDDVMEIGDACDTGMHGECRRRWRRRR
ncbi:MAG: hypothetical protein ACNA8W_14135 [Bradymonadaceae bacterium]